MNAAPLKNMRFKTMKANIEQLKYLYNLLYALLNLHAKNVTSERNPIDSGIDICNNICLSINILIIYM